MVVRYRSTRADIWRAYWFPRDRRALRLGMVALSAVLVVQGISILRDDNTGVSRTIVAMFLFLLALVGSPLYPLLRFKSDERMLEISPSGISTTIGRQSGQIAWSQVARVSSHRQRIYIIGKSGNSFVVPFEAFSSDSEHAEFVESAERWLQEARAA